MLQGQDYIPSLLERDTLTKKEEQHLHNNADSIAFKLKCQLAKQHTRLLDANHSFGRSFKNTLLDDANGANASIFFDETFNGANDPELQTIREQNPYINTLDPIYRALFKVSQKLQQDTKQLHAAYSTQMSETEQQNYQKMLKARATDRNRLLSNLAFLMQHKTISKEILAQWLSCNKERLTYYLALLLAQFNQTTSQRITSFIFSQPLLLRRLFEFDLMPAAIRSLQVTTEKFTLPDDLETRVAITFLRFCLRDNSAYAHSVCHLILSQPHLANQQQLLALLASTDKTLAKHYLSSTDIFRRLPKLKDSNNILAILLAQQDPVLFKLIFNKPTFTQQSNADLLTIDHWYLLLAKISDETTRAQLLQSIKTHRRIQKKILAALNKTADIWVIRFQAIASPAVTKLLREYDLIPSQPRVPDSIYSSIRPGNELVTNALPPRPPRLKRAAAPIPPSQAPSRKSRRSHGSGTASSYANIRRQMTATTASSILPRRTISTTASSDDDTGIDRRTITQGTISEGLARRTITDSSASIIERRTIIESEDSSTIIERQLITASDSSTEEAADDFLSNVLPSSYAASQIGEPNFGTPAFRLLLTLIHQPEALLYSAYIEAYFQEIPLYDEQDPVITTEVPLCDEKGGFITTKNGELLMTTAKALNPSITKDDVNPGMLTQAKTDNIADLVPLFQDNDPELLMLLQEPNFRFVERLIAIARRNPAEFDAEKVTALEGLLQKYLAPEEKDLLTQKQTKFMEQDEFLGSPPAAHLNIPRDIESARKIYHQTENNIAKSNTDAIEELLQDSRNLALLLNTIRNIDLLRLDKDFLTRALQQAETDPASFDRLKLTSLKNRVERAKQNQALRQLGVSPFLFKTPAAAPRPPLHPYHDASPGSQAADVSQMFTPAPTGGAKRYSLAASKGSSTPAGTETTTSQTDSKFTEDNSTETTTTQTRSEFTEDSSTVSP